MNKRRLHSRRRSLSDGDFIVIRIFNVKENDAVVCRNDGACVGDLGVESFDIVDDKGEVDRTSRMSSPTAFLRHVQPNFNPVLAQGCPAIFVDSEINLKPQRLVKFTTLRHVRYRNLVAGDLHRNALLSSCTRRRIRENLKPKTTRHPSPKLRVITLDFNHERYRARRHVLPRLLFIAEPWIGADAVCAIMSNNAETAIDER